MGMEVYAYTNRPKPTPESRRDHSYHVPGLGDPEGALPAQWFSGTSAAELDSFLGSGLDWLVVAVPLTPQTRGMLGAAQFKLLAKKKAFVTNIGRGPTVVTDDLITALDEGWIRGAALDVTEPEPLPKDHPLWHKKNAIITPHVSGLSNSYYARLLAILDIQLERLGEGKDDFLNQVSRKRGY
jgi:phosphoglycerate dehydrogenase-like enzyme